MMHMKRFKVYKHMSEHTETVNSLMDIIEQEANLVNDTIFQIICTSANEEA